MKGMMKAQLVVGSIGLLATGVYLSTDYTNTMDDLKIIEVNQEIDSNKAQFQVNYISNEDLNVAEDNGTESTTTGSSVSVQLGSGNLVTDPNKNPNGIPMYDGYTESGAYFDVDYSRFWNATGELAGLGDWTNTSAKNGLSYEFAKDSVTSGAEGTKYIKQMDNPQAIGGLWTAEGRICVALPPGAMIDPAIFEPMIPTHWTNTVKYTDRSSWTGGAPALSYIPNILDNSLMGMHVDCVLADGTVLALIVTDGKALHTGVYKGRETCNDNLMEGYAHWRGNASGVRSYVGILEVGITTALKQTWNTDKNKILNVAGNKIVSFRCYTDTKGRF